MYAILDVDRTDEDYAENDADWLAVPLSPSMLRATLERIQAAKFAGSYDGSLAHVAYVDHSVTLFGNGRRRYDPTKLVKNPTMSKTAQCDYSLMVIMPDKVRWEGGIKHSAVHWTSDEVSVEQLREWASAVDNTLKEN